MATNLGVRPSTAPLPTGASLGKRGTGNLAPAWPGAENFILPGDGSGGNLGPFNRPERFWLRAGASIIATTGAGWTRYDYKLRLVVNGSYGNDLNGHQGWQKANALEVHTDSWWGTSVEALYYCEANTNYEVYLLSAGGGASCNYYQSSGHYNLWAYTVGEGVY